MKICFDSVDEIKAFVATLKGTRKGKDDTETDTGNVQPPALAMPPQGQPGGMQMQQPAFNPGGQQPAFNPAQGFPGQPAMSGVDPAVGAMVQRIVTRIDGAIAGGQPADAALTWFRTQCGPEAASATLDQIKSMFLPRLPMPSLEQIAKLMGA